MLDALGLSDELKSLACTPPAISIMAFGRAEPIARIPLGEFAQARYGAPYWCLHRQDLHGALARAVERCPNITVTFGFRAGTIADLGAGVRVRDRTGGMAEGLGLVGADGLWSEIRRVIDADSGDPLQARFSGYTAWRTVLPSRVGAAWASEDIVLWLGREAHVVHYPISSGRQLNVVVVLREPDLEAGFDNPGERDTLLSAADWPMPLRSLLESVADWRRWALYVRPRSASWCQGRVLLAGDAAHPVLPFLAQGAAMALEDAWVIGEAVERSSADLHSAWQTVEQRRRRRVERVIRASLRNAQIFHMHGPARWGRDVALRTLGGRRLLSAYDWLYGYSEPANRPPVP